MSRILIAGTMLLLFAAVASFLVPARSAPAAMAAIQSTTPDQISVVRGGIATPLDAGEKLAVTRDLDAVARISVVAGARYTRILSLTLADAAGKVDGATVRISAHMRYMDHGAFAIPASEGGDGTYVALLPFAMPGEWELVIECRAGANVGTLILDIDEYE